MEISDPLMVKTDIMVTSVDLTWTDGYVAELGLFLRSVAGISPKLGGSASPCSGPVTSATGGGTQTPR